MGSLPSRGKRPPCPSSSSSAPDQGPVPTQAERNKVTAVALDSFPAGEQVNLPLRLGEPLSIISEDGDWWTVLSEVSGREYHIPSVHVAKVSHGWLYEGLSREKAEELLLLPGNPGGAFLIRESQSRRGSPSPHTPMSLAGGKGLAPVPQQQTGNHSRVLPGTGALQNDYKEGSYSLSIRLSRPASWDRIRHYRIQCLDNGWLYISPRLTFPSLQALVDHYSELADDICCLLRKPCVLQWSTPLPDKNIPLPVTVQRTCVNWKELDSSLGFLEAPATGEASVLSEGLRESLSSYISLMENHSLNDAKSKSKNREGNQGYST